MAGHLVRCLGHLTNARGLGLSDVSHRVCRCWVLNERERQSWMAGHHCRRLGRLTNARGLGVSDVARRGGCCGTLRTQEVELDGGASLSASWVGA